MALGWTQLLVRKAFCTVIRVIIVICAAGYRIGYEADIVTFFVWTLIFSSAYSDHVIR